MNQVSNTQCHCEELSDVAIRILKNFRIKLNSHIFETFRGTDCHVGLTPSSQ